MRQQLLSYLGALAFLAVFSMNASAGTYKTIVIDDAYADWAGVPVLDSDGGDNAGGPDIGDTQIANDDDFLYIRNTFPNSLSLGTFIALDVDGDAGTGFDVFGLGLIGSEAGWQNDFPFTQDAGSFNNGSGMNGDFFGSGAALLSPFANTSERELAISLDILFNSDNSPVFPNDTFTILLWTDLGVGPDGTFADFNGDVSAPISYTLAIVPEPTTCVITLVGCCLLAGFRRR